MSPSPTDTHAASIRSRSGAAARRTMAAPLSAAGLTLIALAVLSAFTGSWVLVAIGVVAAIVGVYLLLVGIGLFRLRAARRRAEAEQRLDDAVLAAAASSAAATDVGVGSDASCQDDASCVTCDTACILRH